MAKKERSGALTRGTSGKLLTATVGAAAAAGVGYAATRVLQRKSPTVYRVVPNGNRWEIRRDGNDDAEKSFSTKARAVSSARELAHAHEPSRLVIHRSDGTVGRKHSYAERS